MTQPPHPLRPGRPPRRAGGRPLPPVESWFDGPPPEPARAPRMDGVSLVGFVAGVVGVVPLSLPLGVLGLRRTRKPGVGGRNLALAALTLSGCWLAIFAVLALFVIADGRDLGGRTPIAELRVNQCFDADLDQGSLQVVRIADCAGPHAGEAYARAQAALTGLPGADKEAAATQACATFFERFVGRRYEDSELDMYYVVLADRAVADGNVLCMVGSPDEQLVGTMRGSGR